jgi:AraC-like DNA-binding protein
MDDRSHRTWMFPQPPPPDLAADVVCSWRATVAGTHRLVPDGCVDVLWHEGGAIWVCGPETSAWEFTLPSGLRAVGLRFRPGVARQALGTDMHHLTNLRVRLEDLMGHAVESQLGERIGGAAECERLTLFEDAARCWLASARSVDQVDAGIARAATGAQARSVDQLAAAIGLSTRQLHRRSVRLFGYGPTTLMRLLRFQRFIVRAQREPDLSLGVLAAASGYSDQAHLVRECRDFVGLPPSEFLPRHDRTFPAVPDPYRSDLHASDLYKTAG